MRTTGVALFGLLAFVPSAALADGRPARPGPVSTMAVRAAVERVIERRDRLGTGRVAARQTQKPADSTTNGVLIGACIGLGYGLFVDKIISGELGTEQKIMLPITTSAFGAGIGWLVDTLKH